MIFWLQSRNWPGHPGSAPLQPSNGCSLGVLNFSRDRSVAGRQKVQPSWHTLAQSIKLVGVAPDGCIAEGLASDQVLAETSRLHTPAALEWLQSRQLRFSRRCSVAGGRKAVTLAHLGTFHQACQGCLRWPCSASTGFRADAGLATRPQMAAVPAFAAL